MPLVARLARLRRPVLADTTIIPHIFPTSYSVVDRELPALIAKHQPDALLMFGLAPRARALRIESRARNARALRPDAGGSAPRGRSIAPGLHAMAMPAPTRRLLAALAAARVPAAISRDAGQYLCNYLCWQAAQSARRAGGPRLAAFIHVPLVRRHRRPCADAESRLSLDDLARAGARLLVGLAAAAGR
jgi:pyroglutamyl-peptidase